MNKLILYIPFLFLMIGGVLALQQSVTFNGDWKEGTTLYSQVYPSGDYTIYGRDVYPDRSAIQPQTCTIQEVCSKYSYHYVTNCKKYNVWGKCVIFSRIKINDGCLSYTQKKTCSPGTKILCKNPSTGIYTNQLSLTSFKYSIDGITWKSIPYSRDGTDVSGELRFKLDIPNICSPKYFYNDAIIITS